MSGISLQELQGKQSVNEINYKPLQEVMDDLVNTVDCVCQSISDDRRQVQYRCVKTCCRHLTEASCSIGNNGWLFIKD